MHPEDEHKSQYRPHLKVVGTKPPIPTPTLIVHQQVHSVLIHFKANKCNIYTVSPAVL